MASVSGNEFDGIMGGPGSVVPERTDPPAPGKRSSSRKLYLGGLAALVVIGVGGGLLMAKKKEAPPRTELDQLISEAEASAKAKPLKPLAAKAAEVTPTEQEDPPEQPAAPVQALAAVASGQAAETAKPAPRIETSATGAHSSSGTPAAASGATQAPSAPAAVNTAPQGIVSGVVAERENRDLAKALQRVRDLEARLANERRQRSQAKVTVVAVLADGVVLRDGAGKEHVVAVGGGL